MALRVRTVLAGQGQRTIQDAIENLIIKKRLDLPPRLREMDSAIEQAELAIREVLHTALNGDASLIPSHVLQKVDERVSRATRKNAALDPERYHSLEGKLEYFDMRELQDSITNKSRWGLVEPRFVNKVTLNGKFDQLGELRNGIRHSRTVNEITRKEGEAVTLRFKQVFSK